MKRLPSLLLILCILFSIAGCESKGKPSFGISDVPQLSQERKAAILNKVKNWGFAEDLDFANPARGKDGIRYYGSYSYETSWGPIKTCDYIYIPCGSMTVATQLDFGGNVFRSPNAFGLYVYSTYESGGKTYDSLHSIAFPMYTDVQLDEESAAQISYALQLHNAYEYWIHGSVLTEMPQIPKQKEQMRVNAVWLIYSGSIRDFFDSEKPGGYGDYWGTFDGYDVFFYEGVAQAVTTIYVGNVEFSHGCAFTIILHKDGKFCNIQHAYETGRISDETVAAIHDSQKKQ